MKNEPVAWILNGILHEFDPSDWAKEEYPDQDVIPLYTHPAKNNGGNPEELNTRQIQDARTSLESTPPFAYAVYVGEDDRQNIFLQFDHPEMCGQEYKKVIPLYTHPAKTQLSNGHLSDCAIHNEPANRNKDCDCGFEPKFDLSGLKHEDNCRYFDDELYCNCGADSYALVEWYRHKEVTHPAKTLTPLTDEEILKEWTWKYSDCFEDFLLQFARAILRKEQEK